MTFFLYKFAYHVVFTYGRIKMWELQSLFRGKPGGRCLLQMPALYRC